MVFEELNRCSDSDNCEIHQDCLSSVDSQDSDVFSDIDDKHFLKNI